MFFLSADNLPPFLQYIKSSRREINARMSFDDVTSVKFLIILISGSPFLDYFVLQGAQVYDAYDTDIAAIDIYFKTPTIVEYRTNRSQTWVDFFASIGGLLGLCIGISIVTFVELAWLGITILAKFLSPIRLQRGPSSDPGICN